MSKLKAIFSRKKDEGKAPPPAAAEPPSQPEPAPPPQAPPTFSSIDEYAATLPEPDFAKPASQRQAA